MKKWTLLLILAMLLSLGACGSQPAADAQIDVDLTQLSSTMVYSEVFNMMYEPEPYVGKTVRMEGLLTRYHVDSTGNDYYACIIQDATQCCAQGMEFAWAGEHSPEEYPVEGTNIVVTGTFGTYDEDGMVYCQIQDAVLSW